MPKLPNEVSEIEYRLASCLLRDQLSQELPDTERLLSCIEGNEYQLEVAIVALQRGFPYQLQPWQRLKLSIITKWRRRNDITVIIEKLLVLDGIDGEFAYNVKEFIAMIDDLFQEDPGQCRIIEYPPWIKEKTRLFYRCVLQGIMSAWSHDNSDQPKLWKTSERLEKLLDNGSPWALSQVFSQLLITGLYQRVVDTSADKLVEFFIEANEDINGNLLDNFVLARNTYSELLEEGWKPDRWEIENFPMAIDLYFTFMENIGIKQVTAIGEKFMINLGQALEEYRYSGSPFASPEDKKQVIVIAPGWNNQDEVIVRPKVRETTK